MYANEMSMIISPESRGVPFHLINLIPVNTCLKLTIGGNYLMIQSMSNFVTSLSGLRLLLLLREPSALNFKALRGRIQDLKQRLRSLIASSIVDYFLQRNLNFSKLLKVEVAFLGQVVQLKPQVTHLFLGLLCTRFVRRDLFRVIFCACGALL